MQLLILARKVFIWVPIGFVLGLAINAFGPEALQTYENTVTSQRFLQATQTVHQIKFDLLR